MKLQTTKGIEIDTNNVTSIRATYDKGKITSMVFKANGRNYTIDKKSMRAAKKYMNEMNKRFNSDILSTLDIFNSRSLFIPENVPDKKTPPQEPKKKINPIISI